MTYNMSLCNWCQDLLNPNEKYFCARCAAVCFRVCKTCYKPYPDSKYFNLSDIKCNSCCKKEMNRSNKLKEVSRKKSEKSS